MNAKEIKNNIEKRSQSTSGARVVDLKPLILKYTSPLKSQIMGSNSLGILPCLPIPNSNANTADLEVLNGMKGIYPEEVESSLNLFALKVRKLWFFALF